MNKKLLVLILIALMCVPVVYARPNPYRSYRAYKRVYDYCFNEKVEIRLKNGELFGVDYNEIYDPRGLFNDRYYGVYSPRFWIKSLNNFRRF